ncbi:hypothetical protein SMD44_05384 [Streptomyces alboflavus]|uniref:Proteinase inhibitor I42 chagasin domain-containing protein n=1 Tax=Streptomyces alboflavus TaxID=67267 RepID=A0A1Z1WHI9_9ACTN|nr:hypothetical protein [Streptomyces alboflavus]ARX85915.1 hypothetical protein SMD44_05384 [Streptomyces alboflavus]
MKPTHRTAVPLAAGLFVLAAFAATATPATAQVEARAAAGKAVLTNLDHGRTVSVATGDTVEVRLTAYRDGHVTWKWTAPDTDTPDVLRKTAGSTLPNGDARADLHADGVGTATVSATRSCVPDPGYACPAVVLPWKVTVEVK